MARTLKILKEEFIMKLFDTNYEEEELLKLYLAEATPQLRAYIIKNPQLRAAGTKKEVPIYRIDEVERRHGFAFAIRWLQRIQNILHN